eukprot:7559533-Heterocapsa_arctica.AAC.1
MSVYLFDIGADKFAERALMCNCKLVDGPFAMHSSNVYAKPVCRIDEDQEEQVEHLPAMALSAM